MEVNAIDALNKQLLDAQRNVGGSETPAVVSSSVRIRLVPEVTSLLPAGDTVIADDVTMHCVKNDCRARGWGGMEDCEVPPVPRLHDHLRYTPVLVRL